MDILLDRNNAVIFTGEGIEFGKLDASEPNVEKWKLDEHMFAIDNDFTLVQDIEVPAYVVEQPYKYVFDGEKFSINPDWSEPVTVESLMQQITDLQMALAELVEGGI